MARPRRRRHPALRPRRLRPARTDGLRLRARADDGGHRRSPARARRPRRAHLRDARAAHGVRRRTVRPLPAGPLLRVPRRARSSPSPSSATPSVGRASDDRPSRPTSTCGPRLARRPRVGVVKFASCDGCQLTLLDLEDELLAIDRAVRDRGVRRGDLAPLVRARSTSCFVEGSISTPEQAEEIVRLRAAATPARDDRRLRDRRWHPGAAELGRPRRLPRARSTPSRRTSSRSRPRHPSPTTWPSMPSCVAARSRQRSCWSS